MRERDPITVNNCN